MLAVAAIVVDGGDSILLHRYDKKGEAGGWQLFATYVRPGEKLVDAVRRRLKEDAGIDAPISIDFTGRYYDEPGRHPGTYCIPFIFKVVVERGAKVGSGCQWFSRADLQQLPLALDNRQILRDVL